MTKQYTTLLFDVDDTLLDFDAAELAALPLVCDDYGIPYSEEVRQVYRDINDELWTALEQGNVTREELLTTRFTRLFNTFGYSIDGNEADQRYRDYLVVGQQFVPHADEVVRTLAQEGHDLYVVSNGVTETQHKRLKHAGIHQHFKEVFVSEQTGSQKPMRAFFDYVFERIPEINLEQTLIIGDSYGADIHGGYNAGIDTCWLNAKNKQRTTFCDATYEIENLRQLYAILNMKQPI